MIRTSLVGCGNFGRHYARRVAEHPELELVSIVEPDPKGTDAATFDVPIWDSLDDALLDSPTLVIIATPADQSANLAIEALTRHAHVLLAKPGATTLEEANRIVRTARDKHRTVTVDYSPRNTNGWQHLQLEQPRIEMHITATRITSKPPRHPVGPLLDLATHDISLICDLTSHPLRLVSCNTTNDQKPGMLIMKLDDGHGLTASIIAQHNSQRATRDFTIVDDYSKTTWDQLEDTITSTINGYSETVVCHAAKDPITVQLEHTIDAIAKVAEDDADIFLRVMHVIDQAQRKTRGATL